MASEQPSKDINPLKKEFQNLLDQDFKDRKLKENAIIKATVIEILKGHVIVDARGKSEAMIPRTEFKEEEIAKLKVGSSINCFVERIESMKTGEIVLSYEKAKSLAAWEKCVKSHENKEELIGVITNKIKGGYVCKLFSGAISAFLPSSQLDRIPIKGSAVDRLMNTPIKVMIVRIDRARGNLAVSRREVLSQKANAETAEALKEIKENDIVTSTVHNINEWAVFTTYKNIQMMCHVSDLSFSRVKKPSDLVSIGDKLKVRIIKIDKTTNKVSCSVKALVEDPYLNIEKRSKIGEIYEGTVSSIKTYGAFVQIESGIEALCHSSEISHQNRNINPSKVFSVSEKIKFKILSIDKQNRRLSISHKACFPNPWEKVIDQVGEKVKIKVNNVTDKAVFAEIVDSGLNCMMHFKEIEWAENVESLKKFKKGQTLTVKIIEVKDERIRVSLRACEKDPLDWFKDNKKKVGSIISTKVVEVLKSGVKVAVDPEKKVIVMIKKNQLAIEPADCRPEIYSVGNTMADALIEELDYEKRRVVLSPKAAQKKEQDSLIKKFGEGAAKSGATLKSIFDRALGNKEKKK